MALPVISAAERDWLLALRAAPDDLELHRVFADWLEEQGQTERALIIRDACREVEQADEFAEQDPSLTTRRHQDYCAELTAQLAPFGVDRVILKKGILSHLVMSAQAFLDNGAAIAAWAPAWCQVDMVATVPQLAAIAHCPTLARVASLRVQAGNAETEEQVVFGDELACQFANSPYIAGLRSLDLLTEAFTQRGLSAFGPGGNWQGLQDLSFIFCEFPAAADLSGLAKLPQLQQLSLQGTCCGDSTLAEMLNTPGWQHLDQLNLGEAGASSETVLALGQTSARRALRSLDLSRSQALPDAWNTLFQSPTWPNLQWLDLSRAQLPAEQCGRLFHWLRDCPLEVLALEFNSLSEVVLAELARSWQQPTLKTLAVGLCNLNAEAIMQLARAPGLARLRVLWLNENELGATAVVELVSGLFWNTLQGLDLSLNRIEDEGVAILTQAALPSGLRKLSLRGCGLTDQAIDMLVSWSALNHMTELDLSGNRLTDAGVEKLAPVADRLPNLRIRLEHNFQLSPEVYTSWSERDGKRGI